MMGREMLERNELLTSEAPEVGTGNSSRSLRGGQPGLPAAMSKSGRQLFPLPHVACPPKKVGVSRTVARRRNRIRHFAEHCNESVDALNWLSGHLQPGVSCSGMQSMALARMDGLIRSQEPNGAVPQPEEALQALLRGSSPYDGAGVNESLASYQPELVSLPADISGCPFLEDVLAENDRLYLKERSEQMLRGSEDAATCEVKPYWDPILRYNKKEYNALVKKLTDIGYFNFTTVPECFVGIFFVWKSSRTKLRMITDARLANAKFRDAPPVSLMTAEGLGRIEIEFGEEVSSQQQLVEQLAIHVGLSDVENCFHRLRVPLWLSRFFCWEAVPAKVVGLAGHQLEGKTLSPLDAVFPCAGSLCQGFSWALFFAQRANEQMCLQVPPLLGAPLCHDRGSPIVLRIGSKDPECMHYYVYVDNLGVVDVNKERVKAAVTGLETAFDGCGLILHGSEVTSGHVQALGCGLDGTLLRTTIGRERLWKVYQALKGLLARKCCSGKALEKVIGHCTFCGLMNRMSLSCFHAVYKFIQRHYHSAGQIWTSVRKELATFRGILFLLVQEWDRQWNPLVSSSDASLTGFGVCHAWWEAAHVAQVGRVLERSRFRRFASHSARESALTSAGLVKTERGWQSGCEDSLTRLREAGWELDDLFPEVPAAGLRRELWTPKLWGRWFHKEGILILEARTLLKSLKRIAFTRWGHSLRQLLLCDNMSVVLAGERFRAKNFKLLVIIREIASICIARNIHLAVRWIPSELNASDEPSRIFETAGSDLLIDCLGDVWPEGFLHNKAHQQQRQQPDYGQSQSRTSATAPGVRLPDPRAEVPTEEEAERVDPGARRSSAGVEGGSKESTYHESDGQVPEDAGREKDAIPSTPSDGQGAQGNREDVLGPQCREVESRRPRLQLRQQQHFVRAEGRRKRKEASWARKQAKRSSQKAGRPDVGRPEQADSSRAGCCDGSGEAELHQASGRVSQFFRGGAPSTWESSGNGCSFGHLFQQEVSGWRRGLRGRLHHGSPDGCGPVFWKDGQPASASGLEKFERMAVTVSSQVSPGFSPSGLVCHQLEDVSTWPCSESHIQSDSGVHVPSSGSSSTTQKDGLGQTGQWHHASLGSRYKPHRDQRCFKDRNKGRLNSSGLEVDHVPVADVGAAQERQAHGLCVELPLRRVPICLSRLLQRPQSGSCSLSSQTFGTKHRSVQQLKDAGGGQKERRMGVSSVSGEVREGRSPSGHMGEAGQCNSTDLQGRRSEHRGHHPRPALPRHRAAVRSERGQYLADFFSGVGGVAKAARALGFNAREWELLHGENNDLTRPCVVYKIKQDVKHSKIIAAMLAPPCSSFSPARDRTCVVRTKQHPYGVPQLTPGDAEKVRLGNSCFKSAYEIICCLNKYGIPWILENPHSSKCWYLPEMQKLMSLPTVHVRVTDFCCYGTRWRKRTRLLIGNIDPQDSLGLQKTCSGTRGFCGRSNRKHFQLTGSGPGGVPWTRIAQPYPRQLCHVLAHTLVVDKLVVPAD